MGAPVVIWFLKAAEQEYIVAEFNTGIFYYDGVGFFKPKEAFDKKNKGRKWLLRLSAFF